MTQEEKQLLLKDLCARLPYGVKVCARFNTGNRYTYITAISADRDYIQIRQNDLNPYISSSVKDIRPYLRPMSSMTEEEEMAFDKFMCIDEEDAWLGKENGCVNQAKIMSGGIDWLNEHHFDYRGLIEKGLALEALEGMYKI